MKEILEKYIELAIDNGFKRFGAYDIEIISIIDTQYIKYKLRGDDKIFEFEVDILRFITSKEFIESIAKLGPFDTCNLEDLFGIEEGNIDSEKSPLEQRIDRLTIFQSFAIRDGKLEEFILEIINNLNYKI